MARCVPEKLNGSPAKSPLSTMTTSSRRSMRTEALAKAMPACSYSSRIQPAPIPTCSRPPDSTSRVASSLASTAGWRKSWSSTVWLSLMVVVASATACRATRGAKGIMRWSATPKVE